ncbi:serine protease [Neorhizobium sp. P12A]|nr:serine protease [Neorhizobium sp. P12A]
MEVFVLGFPFGVDPPGYPVWKRGSIASEPDLARLTTDYMLVDTASRPGMSGAPVIRRNWSFPQSAEEQSPAAKPSTRFVGIYSGRLKTDTSDEAQIGLVWDASFINEIIAGDTRDR